MDNVRMLIAFVEDAMLPDMNDALMNAITQEDIISVQEAIVEGHRLLDDLHSGLIDEAIAGAMLLDIKRAVENKLAMEG